MANYSKVNFIQHLLGLSERFMADSRLTPWHISLYYSLFQYWNSTKFLDPLTISRTEIMKSSKIGSANTYTKCLKELDAWGYLKYNPSYNPQKGSQVNMYIFNKGGDKGTGKTDDKAANKASVMPLIPYINTTNNINESNITKRENRKTRLNNSHSKSSNNEKSKKQTGNSGTLKNQIQKKRKKVPAKKESHPERSRGARRTRPLLLQVQTYFREKDWPQIEAEKYFNHYQSNGWLVGGKTPMSDWQASAAKWMLNCKEFNQANNLSQAERSRSPKAGNLNVTENKNYNEPL